MNLFYFLLISFPGSLCFLMVFTAWELSDHKVLTYYLTYSCILSFVTIIWSWSEVKWSVSCSVMSGLCNSMDCSLPGSSVREILQARILEWVAISFSRGSSWSRDQTWISCIVGRFFTIWATRKASNLTLGLSTNIHIMFFKKSIF